MQASWSSGYGFISEAGTTGAMMWRWAAQTRYTLRRNTASTMKDLM